MNYTLGTDVVCSVTFKNAAKVIADPSAVNFEFKDPSGNVMIYVYGTDAQLVKDATGLYHVNVNASIAGRWYYRFYATGTGKAAAESSFVVEPSQFS